MKGVLLALLYSMALMCSTMDAVPHSSSLLDMPLSNSAGLSCTKDFVLHDTFCYRYFGYDLKRSFHPAQKMCSKYSSFLVSLHTIDEETFVVQMTQNNSAFWIGLSDEEEMNSLRREGVFQWTDGDHLSSYKNWKIGEPVNKQHLDCVKADHDGWSMAKGGCASSRLPFVCKKRACQPGLEWNGSSCDIAAADIDQDPSPAVPTSYSPHHQRTHSLQTSYLLVYLSFTAIAIATLTMCAMVYSKRRRKSCSADVTDHELNHKLARSRTRDCRNSNRVQDLFPT